MSRTDDKVTTSSKAEADTWPPQGEEKVWDEPEPIGACPDSVDIETAWGRRRVFYVDHHDGKYSTETWSAVGDKWKPEFCTGGTLEELVERDSNDGILSRFAEHIRSKQSTGANATATEGSDIATATPSGQSLNATDTKKAKEGILESGFAKWLSKLSTNGSSATARTQPCSAEMTLSTGASESAWTNGTAASSMVSTAA